MTNKLIKSKERVQKHGEVFTPDWMVKKMLAEPGIQMKLHDIHATFLEPSAGEGAFLTEILRQKLAYVNKNVPYTFKNLNKINNWKRATLWALMSVYGIELLEDNLKSARNAMLEVFSINYRHVVKRSLKIDSELYKSAKLVIELNIVQGNTLTWKNLQDKPITFAKWKSFYTDVKVKRFPFTYEFTFPKTKAPKVQVESTMLEYDEIDVLKIYKQELDKAKISTCEKLYLFKWDFFIFPRKQGSRKEDRFFDVIIGNPPYQEEIGGENNQSKPIYNLFMDNAYKIGKIVELITPARFLTNAGATPTKWNKKMLDSNKIKVIYFEEDSSKVFNGVDIKGGVAVTYYDAEANYEPIGTFIKYKELDSVFKKVRKYLNNNLGDWVHSPDSYRFTDNMFEENPNLVGRTDKAHSRAVASSVFQRYPEIFHNTSDCYKNTVSVIGRENGERKSYFTNQCYLNEPDNLHKWKILMAGAIGSGKYGEALSEPIIASPETAHTQTFLSIGNLDTEEEAKALAKYIKTKFLRAMLGIMKTTQNNQSKTAWSKIPLQTFSLASDIDWSKSIIEIDQQLYKKYNLTPKEIDFIESHVKDMN